MSSRPSNEAVPCIVLTADAWGGSLGVLRSLGRHGVPVYVAAAEAERDVYAGSRYCSGVLPLSLDQPWPHVCEGLLEWARAGGWPRKPMLIPLSDRLCTCVAADRSQIELSFVLPMPDSSLILDMQDKVKACTMAAANGLDVAPFGYADSPEMLRRIAETIRCPAIIRPTWWQTAGAEPFKTVVVDSAEQLVRAGDELLGRGARLIVQEYVPGGDEALEVCMFYRSRDGQTTHASTGFKRRQVPPGAGIMAYGEAADMPGLKDRCLRFVERIDYRGLGGLEFKRSGRRSHFIEMSVRLDGFHPLAIKAGVDLPWLAYCDMVLDRMPRHLPPQKRAYWLDEKAWLALFWHHRGTVHLFREIAPLLFSPRTAFAVWSLSDIRPWFRFVVNQFRKLRYKAAGRPANAEGVTPPSRASPESSGRR